MIEKFNIARQETVPNRPNDERLDAIRQIKNELQPQPQLGEFFRNHPKNTGEVRKVLQGLQLNNVNAIESILRLLKDSDPSAHDAFISEYIRTLQQLSLIYQDYKNAIEEYAVSEQDVYASLNLNGEKFENPHINRMIKELYIGNKSWNDINPDENILPSTFDNEWQRLYQIIRNEDPLSTLGWRSSISNSIRDIIYSASKVDMDEDNYTNNATDVIFDGIDSYFDIENIEPQFIPVVIDLLYQAQELEKERECSFDDPSDEIDQRIHENRDVSFRDTLSTYIENRLKPHLRTAFQEFKYNAVMEAWENSDSDYSDGSEITLTEKQLTALVKESGKNKTVKSFHSHDRASLMINLTKDNFADYVANDAFYVIKRDANGNYAPTTVKDLLEGGGIGGSAMSNDDIGEYRSLMDLRVRSSLEETFGFKLLDLSLKEQYFFLKYLQNITPASVNTIKQFTSLYGVDGMRTFLSLEHGDDTLGDGLIAFGHHNEVARTVFRYYGELLDAADDAETLVRNTLTNGTSFESSIVDQVRENLTARAQKDLERAVFMSIGDETLGDTVHTYVAHAKKYVALLQEMGTQKYDTKTGMSLDADTKAQMRTLLQQNYTSAYPSEQDAAFRATVAASFEKALESSATVFNVYKDEGVVICFNRFDDTVDAQGRKITYFGSFNSDPIYNGAGSVMLEQTITERLHDGIPMIAHCDPTQPITKKYIESGFSATKFIVLAGRPSFEIWRSKDSVEQIASKQKTIDELLALCGENGVITVREVANNDIYPELQSGKALTRFFTHEGQTYGVFESVKA